jgi:hypothetical protein
MSETTLKLSNISTLPLLSSSIRKPQPGKIRLQDVTLALRVPCVAYPDPKYVSEDEEDQIRKEREQQEKMRIEDERRRQKEQERRDRKEARRMLRQEIEERRARGEDIESLASSTTRSDKTSYMSKGSLMQKQMEERKREEAKESGMDRSEVDKTDLSPQKTEDKSAMDDERILDADSKLGKSAVEGLKDPVVSNVNSA